MDLFYNLLESTHPCKAWFNNNKVLLNFENNNDEFLLHNKKNGQIKLNLIMFCEHVEQGQKLK